MSKRKIKTAEAAVGYIRMSSDKQEESPVSMVTGQQRDEILKLAGREAWIQDRSLVRRPCDLGREDAQAKAVPADD